LPKPKDKEDDKKSEPKKDDPVKDLLKKDADDKDKKEGDPKDQKDAKKDNKKEPRPEDWKLVKPENFGKSEVDQLDVDMLLSRLGTLHAERWERQVGKDGLVQYGLDSPGIVVSVTTKTKEGDKEETKTTVLKVGNKSRDEKDKGGYYAIQEGSDFVFVIAGTLQKKLEEAEFRDRLVSKFESKDVKEVDMRILNEKGDFIHDPVAERDGDKGWKKKSGWGGDFDLDPARMDEMVAKMADFKCERYLNAKTPPPAEWKLEGKDVPYKIEFVMNDGKTKHWITIGARQKDEGSYYGMSSLRPGMVFLIPASQVETMMTGRMSWYSKK
jgi:hypothetical protein